MTHSSEKTVRLETLQGLRFMAALLVVWDHSILALIRRGAPLNDIYDFAAACGGLGVAIFFGISGFVMVMTTYSDFGTPGASRAFILRRLLRIIPLYWAATVVALIVLNDHQTFDLILFVKSLLFIPSLNRLGSMAPTLGVGWTLNYEMFFYALFAIFLMFSRKLGLALIIAMLVVLVFSGFLLDSVIERPFGSGHFLLYYLNPIMLYFIIGISVALLYFNFRDITGTISFTSAVIVQSLCVGVAMGFLRFWPGEAGQHLVFFPAVLITLLIAAVAAPPRAGEFGHELLSLGGDSSYSLYLVHGFVLGPLSIIWVRLFGLNPWLPFLPVSLVICSIGGVLCYSRIEKPVLRALRRRLAA